MGWNPRSFSFHSQSHQAEHPLPMHDNFSPCKCCWCTWGDLKVEEILWPCKLNFTNCLVSSGNEWPFSFTGGGGGPIGTQLDEGAGGGGFFDPNSSQLILSPNPKQKFEQFVGPKNPHSDHITMSIPSISDTTSGIRVIHLWMNELATTFSWWNVSDWPLLPDKMIWRWPDFMIQSHKNFLSRCTGAPSPWPDPSSQAR